MPIDSSLVGRVFPPTRPYTVVEQKVRAFAVAVGGAYEPGVSRVPATFPVILSIASMNEFLAEVRVDVSRIIHGEQRFVYERPIVPGDVLISTLRVDSLRQIAGNDILGTTSAITDATGALVCNTRATLIHRGGAL